MVNVLFSASDELWDTYQAPLKRAIAAAGIDCRLATDMDPGDVDYIVYAPNGPVSDFGPFVKTRAILGLWAGVKTMVNNSTLTQPLARMVDPGLAMGMVEWVCGHVLRYHLGIDADIVNPENRWTPRISALARDKTVAILGVGELGMAVGKALGGLGFRVLGWSRRPKPAAPFPVKNGMAGLDSVLKEADFIVLLLPLTSATENTLDNDRFRDIKKGAFLLNPGRGPLIDDDALLNALDNGTIAHATLDVFRSEPLPDDHVFWNHDKITVTPHIASATRPETACGVIAENIRRGESGLPFLHLVDRTAGY